MNKKADIYNWIQIFAENKFIILCMILSIADHNLSAQTPGIDPSGMLTVGKLSGKTDWQHISYSHKSKEIYLSEAERLGLFRILQKSSTQVMAQFKRVVTGHSQYPQFIKYRLFDSEWELIASIITEEVDFAVLDSEGSAREIHKSNRKVHVLSNLFPDHTVTMIAYNCRHPILGRKDIRRALSYAIDKKGFIYKVLEERAETARGPFNSGFSAYENSLESFKYNPKKALRLLNAKHWRDYNGDGILENSTGKPFKIRIIYGKGLVLDEILVRWIKINLNEIGIDVKPLPLKKADIDKQLRSGNFDAVLLSHQFVGNIESIESFFSSGGHNNFMKYYARQVDNYIRFYRNIEDADRRKILLQGMQRIINRDQPANFLYFKLLYYNCINTNRFSKYFDHGGDILPFDQWILKSNATTKD